MLIVGPYMKRKEEKNDVRMHISYSTSIVSITRPVLVLVGSFSYTSHVSFSEESILHSPCHFQWAVLGTLVFNYICMPDVSSSE